MFFLTISLRRIKECTLHDNHTRGTTSVLRQRRLQREVPKATSASTVLRPVATPGSLPATELRGAEGAALQPRHHAEASELFSKKSLLCWHTIPPLTGEFIDVDGPPTRYDSCPQHLVLSLSEDPRPSKPRVTSNPLQLPAKLQNNRPTTAFISI